MCYQLTVLTNSRTLTCTTTGSGNCNVSFGGGAYGSGTTISLEVQKTCTSSTREHVTYIVQGHI
jgi:hypothetical protein